MKYENSSLVKQLIDKIDELDQYLHVLSQKECEISISILATGTNRLNIDLYSTEEFNKHNISIEQTSVFKDYIHNKMVEGITKKKNELLKELDKL